MFDTVTGLPVHILVIHAIVVVLPLAALGTMAVAVVPRWRERFGPLVVLGAAAGLIMVPVATRSGQTLEGRIDAGGVVKEQIEEHAYWGDLVLWPAIAQLVLVVALLLLSRRRRGAAVTLVAVLAVAAAAVTAGTVAWAGHLGSTAVWSCTIGSDACTG